jgi:phosphoadenosine phosphosulfate reductase
MRILQFSGGKDSLACLYLLKPVWNDIAVMWCNTGAAYPETIEQMEKIRKLVPSFYEVRSNQPEFLWHMGYPADLLPVHKTYLGNVLHSTVGVKFTNYLFCCGSNIWDPMHRASKDLGATEIIRGQKMCDKRKSPVRSGQVIEDILYTFPLENWSDEDVFNYLRKEGVTVPGYYKNKEQTSHDCWDCTAYLDENRARIANLPADKKTVVMARLSLLKDAVRSELKTLESVC